MFLVWGLIGVSIVQIQLALFEVILGFNGLITGLLRTWFNFTSFNSTTFNLNST